MTDFIALCATKDILPNQSKGFEIDNVKLFVVHKDQQFYVYKNQCPHLGIELEFMPDQFLDADAELIICSTHGALFEIENGKCLAGPCQNDRLISIELKIDQEQIWVTLR